MATAWTMSPNSSARQQPTAMPHGRKELLLAHCTFRHNLHAPQRELGDQYKSTRRGPTSGRQHGSRKCPLAQASSSNLSNGSAASTHARPPSAREVVFSLFDALNRRDVSCLMGLLAEDVSYENLAAAAAIRGRSAVARFYLDAMAALPEDAMFVLEDVTDGERLVGLSWHAEVGAAVVPLSRGLGLYTVDEYGLLARVRDSPEQPVKMALPVLSAVAPPLLRSLGAWLLPGAGDGGASSGNGNGQPGAAAEVTGQQGGAGLLEQLGGALQGALASAGSSSGGSLASTDSLLPFGLQIPFLSPAAPAPQQQGQGTRHHFLSHAPATAAGGPPAAAAVAAAAMAGSAQGPYAPAGSGSGSGGIHGSAAGSAVALVTAAAQAQRSLLQQQQQAAAPASSPRAASTTASAYPAPSSASNAGGGGATGPLNSRGEAIRMRALPNTPAACPSAPTSADSATTPSASPNTSPPSSSFPSLPSDASAGANSSSSGSGAGGPSVTATGHRALVPLPFSTSLDINLTGLWEKDKELSQVEEYEAMMDVLELGGLQKVTGRLIDGLDVKHVPGQAFEVNFVTVVPFFRVTEASRYGEERAIMRRDLRSGKQTTIAEALPGGVLVRMRWDDPVGGTLLEEYVALGAAPGEQPRAMQVRSIIAVGSSSAEAIQVYFRSSAGKKDFLASKRAGYGSMQDVLSRQEERYGKLY